MVPVLRCSHQGALEVERERPEQYTCAGCAQFGYGPCWRCTLCGSRLHEDCSFHEDTITHPFFPGSVLRFHSSGDPSRRCDACGRDIDGYVYHSSADGYDLHPTCASLKESIHVPDMKITLFLRKEMSSKCCSCGKKELDGGRRPFRSWGYESISNEYCLHVSCANDILMEVEVGNQRRWESMEVDDFINHAFFPGRVFRYQRSAGSGRYCNACGRDVRGPFYHCSDKGYDLHQTCATLQRTIRVRGMEAPLVLRGSMTSKCAWCGKKKPENGSKCWGYESKGKEYYHVYCAMELLEIAGEEEVGASSGREVMDKSYAAPAGDLVVLRRPGRKGGSFAKFMNIVKIAVTALISALVGDPTTLIATFVATMLTNN